MGDAIKIEDLSCNHVDTKPVDVPSWESEWSDRSEEGEPCQWEAARCETCNAVLVFQDGGGDEKHRHAQKNAVSDSSVSGDEDERDPCDGYVGLCEGPMMSYAYPCAWGDGADAAALLVDLPVVPVVLRDGTHALALTGGGMDLSWEICEAYVRLGFLPPLHYARDLPRMAGLWLTDRRALVLDVCERSASIMEEWAKEAGERIRTLRCQISGGNPGKP